MKYNYVERLVDRDTRWTTAKESRYACQMERSTETALGTRGGFVIGIFIDIEGVFHSNSVAIIEEALRKYKVPC